MEKFTINLDASAIMTARPTPEIITVFNNKGGVGKTTLTYHLAHALGELGKRVLLIDLDPQCNLTIFSLSMEQIHAMWKVEDPYIDDFAATRSAQGDALFSRCLSMVRSIHFTLKPTEDGTAELPSLPPPVILAENVHMIPGRLTLHHYEAKVGERWSGIYQGDPLSIRTGTRVRALAHEYASAYEYDIVICDTSPSLGALNRNLLSLADGFIVPCSPDLFSMYGIRNIGNALDLWRKQFETIFHFLSDSKRSAFPSHFVRFMGYTIYNAKKYSGQGNPLDLAAAHYNYAQQIPITIGQYIDERNMIHLSNSVISESIGGNSVIHTHNTLPTMAQKYRKPMWMLPGASYIEDGDRNTINGNSAVYRATQSAYHDFAEDFLLRMSHLHD